MRVSQKIIKILNFFKNLSIIAFAKNNLKMKNVVVYSVLNEEPHEQDFVTFGLLILNPEPIRLSI
jgi:hypothetical protein